MRDDVACAIDEAALPFRTDDGIGSRANLGLLVCETDQTVEAEFRALLPSAGVGLYGARIHNDVVVTEAMLARMRDDIPVTTGLLPPGVDFDVIGFACTSGAIVIGEDTVAALVRSARPARAVTDPISALKAAVSALGIERWAVVTPYSRAVNERLRDSLASRGVRISAMASFYEENDNVVARIAPESVRDAVVRIGSRADVDGVFVSCTTLRAVSVIAAAERAIGKPVTSSNHVLAWHMLRLAGVPSGATDPGLLFAA